MRHKTRQKGFTLIEIIAVLVLLGILAAVAVPRFIGMQDQARTASADSIIAAGVSQINMVYAHEVLRTGSGATGWNAVTTVPNPQAICDQVSRSGFDTAVITCEVVGADITVSATVAGQAGSTVTIADPNP